MQGSRDDKWLDDFKAHKALALNWRGRRLRVCRAIDDIIECIDHLGEQPEDETSQFDSTRNVGARVQPDFAVQLNGLPVVTDREKDALRELARALNRMILIKNDGG